ncbi:Vesicle transport v-SNARE 13 [Glycine soja]|uniref:Vesicle transport v-SNARE 13 n=2 Tax=Glycine soja TaxID=3848 RepID=A0A445J5F0_GLYSO|nr:Vesicle transport v-SNARE 13 [Glycine soja]
MVPYITLSCNLLVLSTKNSAPFVITFTTQFFLQQLQRMSCGEFEGYERQYCELSANLSKACIDNVAAPLNGELKKQKKSEIKEGIEEGEALIRKMDLDARSLQPDLKAVLLAKVREYKADLNNIKREVKKIISADLNPSSARDELLESTMTNAMMKASADHRERERLMISTKRLNKSSDRINDSRGTMLETEDLGISILQDLHSQRQSLLHTHDTLHGVDDNTDKSKKILSNMSRRMDKSKWILSTIAVLLIFVIILIVYFKLS